MKLLKIKKKKWECCREEGMNNEKIQNKGRLKTYYSAKQLQLRSILVEDSILLFFVRILFKPNMCIMVTIY